MYTIENDNNISTQLTFVAKVLFLFQSLNIFQVLSFKFKIKQKLFQTTFPIAFSIWKSQKVNCVKNDFQNIAQESNWGSMARVYYWTSEVYELSYFLFVP